MPEINNGDKEVQRTYSEIVEKGLLEDMKVLVVGEYRWEIYEKPLYKAFCDLGYDTDKFEWKKYFETDFKLLKLFKRAEAKYRIGPAISRMNRDLIRFSKRIKPDLIFIYQGVYFSKSTIENLRTHGSIVFGYCNDDPFSEITPKFFWRKYLKSCSAYDRIFAYRLKNIDDYKNKIGIGAELLRSYYLDERNYKTNAIEKKYACDVMFIGHYEDDNRDEILTEIIKRGFSLQLYGEGWKKSKYYEIFNHVMNGDIKQLREEYNIALNSCKIALVFLSKRNNDTYTRRCFEIPATGTFMLSEYSDDLTTLFRPDVDAAFFTNQGECIKKIEYYLINEAERLKIAENGFEKVHSDGHEIKDRVKQIVLTFQEILEKRKVTK